MKPSIYELWKVDVDPKTEKVTKKIEHIRNVSISDREAEDQNQDTPITKLRLYSKSNGPDDEKQQLWNEINSMNLSEDIKKPHHMAGIEKLREFIENNKK